MTGRDERTTRARIQDAALRLFAERGFHATTVRQIAEAASVSPALVMHHFGSKDGLREAVDDEVLWEILEPLRNLQPSDEPLEVQFFEPEEQFRAIFIERPELGDYLRRMLIDDEHGGARILNPIIEAARNALDRFESQGVVRSAKDEEMRAVMLTLIDLGVIILRPMLEHRFGHPVWSQEIFGRWVAAEFEILRGGILIDPPRTLDEERDDS